MATVKYEPTYRDFKRYTEDTFATTYRSGSDADQLVNQIIYGLPRHYELVVLGFIEGDRGRAKKLPKDATQDQITGMFHGAWLVLYKSVYGVPFTNPNRRNS